MKRSFSLVTAILLVAFSLVVCSNNGSSSQLTMSPAKARPGDTVTFAYIPADKNLASREAFSLYLYSYSKELPEVQAIDLKKSGKKWTATYSTDKKPMAWWPKSNWTRITKIIIRARDISLPSTRLRAKSCPATRQG